jgi:C-terminal processing protease CtpA/Prc
MHGRSNPMRKFTVPSVAVSLIAITALAYPVFAKESPKPIRVFEGIGVQLNPTRTRDGWFEIAGVPKLAEQDLRAVLKKGDRIVAVNGASMRGKSLQAVIDRVSGPAGTSVRLTLRRPNVDKPIDVTVARKAIPVYAQ